MWDLGAMVVALGWLLSETVIRRFCAERDKIAERRHSRVDAETSGVPQSSKVAGPRASRLGSRKGAAEA